MLLQRWTPVQCGATVSRWSFKEPMTALNPTRRVGDLIAEGARVHQGLRRAASKERALELMRDVGIPDPSRRARAWPWELSGGMRQRVMIAMALSCEPRVLLCDEPTTALDVTVQAQIIRLLDRLRQERGLSIVFVTHDLPLIAQIAHKVAVMYSGEIVESGPLDQVFRSPHHPYTKSLLAASSGSAECGPNQQGDTSSSLLGGRPASGCRFAPRCPYSEPACRVDPTELIQISTSRTTSCRLWSQVELSRK